MRLGWLVSAGVCALFVACSGSTHKKVLLCDAAVCNPVEAGGAAGAADNQPGEAGTAGAAEGGAGPGPSADAGAPGAQDAGPNEEAGGAGPDAGPPPPSATLEVTLAGNGSVAVTDADACLAGPCQYPLTDGALLTLEAKPGPGSRFVGWSGACMGATPITTVTVSGLKECNATFALQRAVSVSVDVAGNGTVSTDPSVGCAAQGCSGQVDDNSTLTLHAIASAGYRFVSWTGSSACEGSELATLPLVITADLTCIAKFSQQYQVSVSALGAAGAMPSVHTGTCTALSCLADGGTMATFNVPAIDPTGFRFAGWTGDAQCTGTGKTLVLAVTSNIACVANYRARYRVSGVVGSGLAGTVTATSADVNSTCSTNSCLVDAGTSTTLVAPTISGYRLTGWTGAGCPTTGQGNGLTVTPTTAEVVCTATYALGVSVTGTVVGATGAVTATSTSPGAACTPGGCGIDAGGSVSLTAPNLLPTFRFVNWTGDAGCAGAALTLALANVTSSKSCHANYLQQFTIVAKANAGGTASAAFGAAACANGSCTVDAGTGVVLTATPDAANGYHFTSWTGTNCAPPGTSPITLSNLNTTCTANFALNTFTITASAGTNGSVTATRADTNTQCGGASCTVSFGTNVALAATPAPHYHFAGWAGAGCPTTGTPITLKNVNATCNATFAIDTFTASAAITPTAAGTASISCTPNACSAVPYGTLVNIAVAVNAGWALVGWSPGCNAGGVTVTANTACVATYRPIVTGIGAPASAGSVVVTSPGTATCVAGNPATCAVDSGSTVTLTPKPAVDSVFTGWSGDCSGAAAPYSLTGVTAPRTCTANYYQLWAQATGTAFPDLMPNVVGLADGTVVGFGTSAGGGRGTRLALVDLAANTGKLGRNQIISDTASPGTATFAAVGLAVTANQKNVIALGIHRAPGTTTTQYPWLHNEQAPAWEYEYKYGLGPTAGGAGNVIPTLDGGYAFCIFAADAKLGNVAHLTKVDGTGKPTWDLVFHERDPNNGNVVTMPVDVIEDPNKRYFAVLSAVGTAPAQLMISYVSEAGAYLSSDLYGDALHDLNPARFVAVGTDTFLVAGARVFTDGGDSDGFYAQLTKGNPKAALAYAVGSPNTLESFAAITRTPTGFAVVGQYTDPALADEAWLVQLSSANAITAQFAYGGPGATPDAAAAVYAMPAGGLVVSGSTSSWGAGGADMWTVRLDANANITFNGASAAHRTATAYARAAVNTLGAITPNIEAITSTVTPVAPSVTVTTAGFAQNQQAP
ncbi:MAG: hypothetical protein ABJB12_10755 [Pseudomonadota bacterium]